MKIYQLGLYEKALPAHLTWQQKLQATKDSGFDFLEISIDETEEKLSRLNWSSSDFSHLEKAMTQANCFLRTLCLSGLRRYPLGSRNAEFRQQSLIIMQQTIEFAWRLGIRIIQIAGYDVYYEESGSDTRAFFEENLIRCAEMAAAKGVLLGFETMETPFMDTTCKSMSFVNKIASPYLQVYPDAGNLTNAAKLYGTNVLDDILTGQGHIIAVHLKETMPGVYRNMKFGKGHTDFASCSRIFYSLGVRLFTGEFWHQGEANWQEIVASSASFLRSKIEEGIRQI